MKIGMQDVNWEHVGACLARADDTEQTKFFKSFVKECLSWGTNYQVEYQLAGINLTPKEKEVLGMLSFTEQSG